LSLPPWILVAAALLVIVIGFAQLGQFGYVWSMTHQALSSRYGPNVSFQHEEQPNARTPWQGSKFGLYSSYGDTMLAVCAGGRILNPKSARSQVIGAMVMGV
jgi:hypothetical protein